MSKLKKVLPGQSLKISAATYNLFVDAANDYLQRRMRLAGGASGFQRPAGIIPVKNNSGSDQLRFAVLGLDEPIYSPTDNEMEFKNNPSMKAITPTTAHFGRFVVLQEPLAIGAIGRGMVMGVTPMRIESIPAYMVGTELWADANWALVALKGSGGGSMTTDAPRVWQPGTSSTGWWGGCIVHNTSSTALAVVLHYFDTLGREATYATPDIPAHAQWNSASITISDLNDVSGYDSAFNTTVECRVVSDGDGHSSADIEVMGMVGNGTEGLNPMLQKGGLI